MSQIELTSLIYGHKGHSKLKKCSAESPETLVWKKLKLYFPVNDVIRQCYKNCEFFCLFQELLLDNHQKEAERRIKHSRFECPHCKTLQVVCNPRFLVNHYYPFIWLTKERECRVVRRVKLYDISTRLKMTHNHNLLMIKTKLSCDNFISRLYFKMNQ